MTMPPPSYPAPLLFIESGVVEGRNFVQVGLRGYWPPADTLAWMGEQRMRWHLMTEIERTLRAEGYDQVLLVPAVPEHAGLINVPKDPPAA